MNTRSLLSSLGIRTTLKGFRYLQYALELCMQDEDYLLLVYKWLCTDVASHFHTSQNNVEHCIRTAVANCWPVMRWKKHRRTVNLSIFYTAISKLRKKGKLSERKSEV